MNVKLNESFNEWKELILEAKKLGLTTDEVKDFFNKIKEKNERIQS
jgi:DNA-binding transcriptional regulator YhcF (GntR family)